MRSRALPAQHQQRGIASAKPSHQQNAVPPTCLRACPLAVDYHNSVLPACETTGLSRSETALRNVLAHFERLARPTLHLLGEHPHHPTPPRKLPAAAACPSQACSRRQAYRYKPWLFSLPCHCAPGICYYTFQPSPGWRFIMLDGYDVSILGWPPGEWMT